MVVDIKYIDLYSFWSILNKHVLPSEHVTLIFYSLEIMSIIIGRKDVETVINDKIYSDDAFHFKYSPGTMYEGTIKAFVTNREYEAYYYNITDWEEKKYAQRNN